MPFLYLLLFLLLHLFSFPCAAAVAGRNGLLISTPTTPPLIHGDTGDTKLMQGSPEAKRTYRAPPSAEKEELEARLDVGGREADADQHAKRLGVDVDYVPPKTHPPSHN